MKLLRVRHSNMFGSFALVDDNEFEQLSKRSWRWTEAGYVITGGYWRSQDGTKTAPQLLHRIIARPSDDLVVDHFNGNKNDNQKSNLRVCTATVNSLNKFGSAQFDFKISRLDIVVVKAFYKLEVNADMEQFINTEKSLIYKCHKKDLDQYISDFKSLGFTNFTTKQDVKWRD